VDARQQATTEYALRPGTYHQLSNARVEAPTSKNDAQFGWTGLVMVDSKKKKGGGGGSLGEGDGSDRWEKPSLRRLLLHCN
jgi:hypothetical protein